MDQKTLERVRPRDGSSDAIRTALAAAAEERAAASLLQTTATAAHDRALLDPAATGKDIAAHEKRIDEATLMLRRLDLIEPELRRQLLAADVAEVAVQLEQAAEKARLAFVTALEEFRTALAGYEVHAAAIALVCQLEQAKDRALVAFRQAATAHLPFPRPPAADPDPGVPDVASSFAKLVVLPRLRGEPMIWGSLPPRQVPELVIRYG